MCPRSGLAQRHREGVGSCAQWAHFWNSLPPNPKGKEPNLVTSLGNAEVHLLPGSAPSSIPPFSPLTLVCLNVPRELPEEQQGDVVSPPEPPWLCN